MFGEQPETWTTGTWGKDARGHDVGYLSPHAVCFCAEGALYRAGGFDLGDVAATCAEAMAGHRLTLYNDHQGREATICLLLDTAADLRRHR